MTIMTKNEYSVKIAVNKSLLKEFVKDSQRTVYMNNGTEFQIQIFNPYSFVIGAKISINNQEMSNMLVLKPGQRVWLERFLDSNNKFLFETYEVNNSRQTKKAIVNNGVVKIDFYKESEPEKIQIHTNPIRWDNYTFTSFTPHDQPLNTGSIQYFNNTISCSAVSDNNYLSTTNANITNNYTSTATYNSKSFSKPSIETGRIEKGGYSNQEFQTTYNDFEYFPFHTEKIHILPQSRKPITSNDLEKRYCHNCGRKLNQKFKFCPFCGTKQ